MRTTRGICFVLMTALVSLFIGPLPERNEIEAAARHRTRLGRTFVPEIVQTADELPRMLLREVVKREATAIPS